MQNRRVVALLVVSVLLASFLTYVFASSPSTTMTISSGQYPGASCYSFYQVSGTAYAKDQNGKVDFHGTDVAAVFQDAVDNLPSTGGKIIVSYGVYTFTSAITGVENLVIEGEFRGDFEDFTSEGTLFIYSGGVVDAFFDFRNCRSVDLVNIKLKNSGSATRGVWFGGTLNDASKTKAVNWRNVIIDGFDYGLQGYTFGPDDSNFYNLFIGNCAEIAVDHLSSQCRFFGGSIYQSDIGLRIYRDAGASADAGMEFFGTVFSGMTTTAIDIIGNQSMNILAFYGCWLEDNDNLILRTTGAQDGVTLGSVTFDTCVMTTAGDVFDLRHGGLIYVNVNQGTLYPISTPSYIYGDGSQYISIKDVLGWERITLSGELRGKQSCAYLFFNDANGYNPAGWQGTSYASGWQDQKWPFFGKDVINATVYWRWNPGTTSGGIALYYSATRFGISEPGASGARVDMVDITAFVRANCTYPKGEFGIQAKGDGGTAPTLYYCEIIVEW